MNTTQQPEALRLADKYEAHGFLGNHRFAQEHWCRQAATELRSQHARILELEAVLSAMGEKGNPVKPADIPRATDQDTHFFLAGWNGRAAQVDSHEHFRNAAATAPADPAEGVPAQIETLRAELAEETEAAENWRRLALQFDHHRLQALGHLKAILHPDSSVDEYKTAELFLKAPPLDGESVLAQRIAELSTATQAQAAAPAVLPEPAAWLATFRPKGMSSSHSIAGANFEELKRSVPSDSVFKPLYTRHASQGLEQFIEQVGDVHFQRCRIGSKDGKIRWDIEFGHYDAEVRGKTLREAITKAIAAQAKQGE